MSTSSGTFIIPMVYCETACCSRYADSAVVTRCTTGDFFLSGVLVHETHLSPTMEVTIHTPDVDDSRCVAAKSRVAKGGGG